MGLLRWPANEARELDISVAISGFDQLPSSNSAHCTVTVQFDGPVETMHLTVLIPTEPAARSVGDARNAYRLVAPGRDAPVVGIAT
jgi:hypothetical protein